jgi:hypothetical protein
MAIYAYNPSIPGAETGRLRIKFSLVKISTTLFQNKPGWRKIKIGGELGKVRARPYLKNKLKAKVPVLKS